MDLLSVTVSTSGSLPVVAARGEVDVTSVAVLEEALDAQFEAGTRSVVVDFLGVTFLDSTGLSALVRAHRRCAASGGRLALVMADPQLLRLLAVTGLDRLIPAFATVDAALADAPPS